MQRVDAKISWGRHRLPLVPGRGSGNPCEIGGNAFHSRFQLKKKTKSNNIPVNWVIVESAITDPLGEIMTVQRRGHSFRNPGQTREVHVLYGHVYAWTVPYAILEPRAWFPI